jgi:hypothetical protein
MLLKRKKQLKSLISNMKGVAIFATALLLLSGVFYLNQKFENNRMRTDKDTFCQAGAMPEITAILVDHTDNFTPIQREALRKTLRDIAFSVNKNSMIQLYDVGSIRASVLQPKFSLCNPGNGDDLENELARRASTVRRNYEDIFVKKLDVELKAVLTAEAAKESPIMESIQSVLVTAFAGRDRAAPKKTLVIASDLLEYTPALSFLKGVPDFDTYKKTIHWQNIRSDMRDIDVKLLFIRREKGQSNDLLLFWQHYFENQNAKFLPPELM